jgi:hypothetical protein
MRQACGEGVKRALESGKDGRPGLPARGIDPELRTRYRFATAVSDGLLDKRPHRVVAAREEPKVLSIHRVVITAAAAAVAAAAPAAQARPVDVPQPSKIDRVSPDARDQRRVNVMVVPHTRVVEVPSHDGFEWGDAAVGGGAALAVVLLISGGAVTVRPRRAPVTSR